MVQIFLLMLRLLEKSFELKTQEYEKQIRSLREEIKALKDEKMQLQHQLEEERVTSDGLKGEVVRLSKQAKVGLLASWLICLTCTREWLHVPSGSAKSIQACFSLHSSVQTILVRLENF